MTAFVFSDRNVRLSVRSRNHGSALFVLFGRNKKD